MFQKLVGGLMVAAGILIAGASGLCSLAFASGATRSSTYLNTLLLVLLFGGIPFIAGVMLVLGGVAVIRNATRNGSDNR